MSDPLTNLQWIRHLVVNGSQIDAHGKPYVQIVKVSSLRCSLYVFWWTINPNILIYSMTWRAGLKSLTLRFLRWQWTWCGNVFDNPLRFVNARSCTLAAMECIWRNDNQQIRALLTFCLAIIRINTRTWLPSQLLVDAKDLHSICKFSETKLLISIQVPPSSGPARHCTYFPSYLGELLWKSPLMLPTICFYLCLKDKKRIPLMEGSMFIQIKVASIKLDLSRYCPLNSQRSNSKMIFNCMIGT